MSLVDKIKNPKNFIPEIGTILGADGFAIGAIYLSDVLGLNEFESSTVIPFMKSSGALIGKLAGYGYSHREMFEEDFKIVKKDFKNICKIMVPYQAINYCVQSSVLYGLQNSAVIDSSDDKVSTFLTIVGVDAICSVGRYFLEHKVGILK